MKTEFALIDVKDIFVPEYVKQKDTDSEKITENIQLCKDYLGESYFDSVARCLLETELIIPLIVRQVSLLEFELICKKQIPLLQCIIRAKEIDGRKGEMVRTINIILTPEEEEQWISMYQGYFFQMDYNSFQNKYKQFPSLIGILSQLDQFSALATQILFNN